MNRRGCLLIAAVNQYICITFLYTIRKLSCTIPLTLLVRCPTFLLEEWKTKLSALKKIAYVSEVCSAVIICMALKPRGLEFGVCWRKHWTMTSPGENPWFGVWRMWEFGREGQLVLSVGRLCEDWSNLGCCKEMDQTGTSYMELYVLSATPYSCTGKPRCKSSTLCKRNHWNISSEVLWLTLCSEFIFFNLYFFFIEARPGRESCFKKEPVLSYRDQRNVFH